MKKFTFITSCVNAIGKDIQEMVDKARDISFRTFFRYVDLKDIQEAFGYHRDWLLLRDDYHVTYHKGNYRGVPCYFMKHSAIEYVYVHPDHARKVVSSGRS